MKHTLRGLAAPALLASLVLVSANALADVSLTDQGMTVDSYLTMTLKLPASDIFTGYYVGSQNIAVGNSSFQAFCVDPYQYSALNAAFPYGVSSSLSALNAANNASVATDVSRLYSQSYAGTANNAINSAAFQLALWELIAPP